MFYCTPPIIGATISFGIGLGNGWLRGDTGSPWCDFGPYNWGMVTVVYFSLSVICLLFFSCTLVKLLMVWIDTYYLFNNELLILLTWNLSSQKNRELLLKNKFLMLFLCLFLWVFGFASFVGLYYNINIDEYEESFVEWVLCNASMEDNCSNKSSIPMWMIYIDYVNYTATGVYMFFILGLQRRIRDHWREMIKQIMKGNFRALWNLSGTRSKVTSSTPKISGVRGSSSNSPQNSNSSTPAGTSHSAESRWTSLNLRDLKRTSPYCTIKTTSYTPS